MLSTSLTSYALLMALAPHAYANPEDGVVVGGAANIVSSGTRVDVNQSSNRAVIDWRSFNINANETTAFHQPSSSSLTVNRVNDGNPTSILGHLSANGNVVLINPSGIAFGAGSVVDVNGLVATTSDISNTDAMNGNLVFHGTGGHGSVVNDGTITASDAGLVGLVAPSVENNGIINARLGKVQLAAGDTYTLDLYGDGLMNVTASDDVTNEAVKNSGTINAESGIIAMTAAAGAHVINSLVNIAGELKAASVSQKGGKIVISGDVISNTATLDASGTTGGSISLSGRNIIQQGHLKAKGTNGKGGTITTNFSNTYLDSEQSTEEATGQNSDGGTISVLGAANPNGSHAFLSGTYDASSTTGNGGTVDITTDNGDLKLFGAHVSADGKNNGGQIHIGGNYQGSGTLAHASTTGINYVTYLSANGTTTGNGGQITVWSDDTTQFAGHASARALGATGNGGLIELSSKDELQVIPAADIQASAAHGTAGQLLLDPKNITIAAGGISNGISYFQFTDPNPDNLSGGTFGYWQAFKVLSNGNVIIMDGNDGLVASGAGAVYLFNGATGALISTLTGSVTDDHVGMDSYGNQGSVVILSNGNFLINSGQWDNGGMADVGAVTWMSGTTGAVGGVVSVANSLIGGYAGAGVSSAVALTNGNYVVSDYNYSSGAGAATWGNGTTGSAGVISAANSLVGGQAGAGTGSIIAALANGNYAVLSPYWDNGGATDAGAVTLGNGTTGTIGTVSAANSLVGTHTNDQIGFNQWGQASVFGLSNGNFLVGSALWDNGGITDAGALTFVNGTTGLVGAVSAANSLVDNTANDFFGDMNVNLLELGNGKFVIGLSGWDNGAATNAGAVIMGSMTTGVSGTISAVNALVGTTTDDNIGAYITPLLGNHNFLVNSLTWDNGSVVDAGSVTWVDGTAGRVGAVSAANSLVGSIDYDQVGSSGILTLSNGNYVIGSTAWDHGAIVDAGASTWGNGSSGVSGTITSSNSLLGSNAYEALGNAYALPSGNYVVASALWDNGAVTDVGAVTLVNGLTGTTGFINPANSIIGTTAGDQVGGGGVQSVGTNNFIILSPSWDNGGIVDSGAVTWLTEAGGTHGTVSISNSLYSSTADSFVGGTGAHTMINGNYLVFSGSWDNGTVADVGAVTWGNGNTGVFGAVSASNSLVGSTAGDIVGNNPFWDTTYLPNGNYIVMAPYWDNGALVDAGAVTWGNGTTGVSGVIGVNNSIVGSHTNDQLGWEDWYLDETVFDNSNYALHAIWWNSGQGAIIIIDGTTGTTGEISGQNAFLGTGGNTWPQYMWTGDYEDHVNNRYVVSDGNNVYSINLNVPRLSDYNSYSDMAAANVTLSPNFITNILNSGTSVVLQANNDITLNSDLNVSNNYGDGGTLTFQAGRSILLNANIDTDNGDLNLFANEDLSTGVVDVQRDPGSAVITMASTKEINTGTGNVNIRLDDGTGKTNKTAGDITLRDIHADTITVQNKNTTGDVVLKSGTLTASGTGDAITLVSARNFKNMSGASALDASAGRWLVYSTNPAADQINSLVYDARRFSCVYGGACPSFSATDNMLLYSYTPTVTVTPDAIAAIHYGDAVPSLTNYSYSFSGYLDSDESLDGRTGTLNGSTTYTATSGVNTYNINHASGTLTSNMGYAFTYANNASGITVNKKDLTVSFSAPLTKIYGNANPTLDYTNFNFGTLVGTDSASLFTSITPNYGTVDANTNVSTGNAVTAAIGSTANYNIINTPATTLAITARPLSVVTDAKSKTYGDADPTLTGSNNLTANDAALITWLYSATGYTGNAGTYGITATATDPSSRLSNYTRTNTYNNLVVAKKDITASFTTPLTKIYGDANPTIDYNNFTFSTLVGSDSASLFSSITPNFGAVNNNTGVGSYAASASIASTTNYNVTNTPSTTLAITARPLSVTTDAQSKIYGDADPTFTGTNNLTAHDAGLISWAYAPTGYSGNAGTYAIAATATDPSSLLANYTRTNTYGNLVVAKKDITAAFIGTLTKNYGDANPTLTYSNFTFSTLVGSDSASLFTSITPNYGTVGVNTDVSAGNAVTAAIGSTANYNVTNTPATTLSIIPRALTVTTNAKFKAVDAADPAFTGSANLTAYDAALISWAYGPAGYSGLEGSYTIDATATDPSSRLANYTRTNSYGLFTVGPAGSLPPTTITTTDPSMPNTYLYVSQSPSMPSYTTQWGNGKKKDEQVESPDEVGLAEVGKKDKPNLAGDNALWIIIDPLLASILGLRG